MLPTIFNFPPRAAILALKTSLMEALTYISRIIHVTTAIALVGGSIFMLVVLLPAAKALSEEAHDQLREGIMKRWKKIVHPGILLFLVTGFYNFYLALPAHKGDGLYHALVGTKILLALGVFFLASVLVGKSTRFQAMREARQKWLTIMVAMALVIVGISGFVKVRGPSGTPSESIVEPVQD